MEGQYRNFITTPYHWDHTFEMIEVEEGNENFNAIALKEENRFVVHGRKEQFMNLYFEQRGMIKYQNQEGIFKHNAFLLPLALDPLHEQQYLDIEDKAYAPYFNVEVLFFAGRILKSNGDVEQAIFRYAFPDKLRIINEQFERVFMYYVQVTNLEQGDVLEYHFKYEIPYDVNWMHFNSGRIFHHGELHKQNYSLQIEHPRNLRCSFYGESPNTVWEDERMLKQQWTKKNLSPLIKEPGSRPHMEIAHIEYKINQNNFKYVYSHPRTSQILATKFYNYVARLRQQDDFWFRRVARRNFVLDKQGQLFRTWMDNLTEGKENSLGKLKAVNADIARNFQFYDDRAYYALLDFGLERMGEFTQGRRLRDISRHNLYTKIMNRVGFDNYKVLYLLDKRVGRLGADYPSNLYFNERLFYSNDSLEAYLLPKRTRMGYEVNELPFYFQNTQAFGYTLDQMFEDGINEFLMDSIRVFSEKNNRRSDVIAHVNIQKNHIDFQADLSLQGQWSTLTRGAYLYNQIDSTINPNYAFRLFEIEGDVQLERIEQINFVPEDEFKMDLKIEYGSKRVMRKQGDVYSIPIEGMLNYVLWDDMNFEPRFTDFYADFSFDDAFEYVFQFNEKVLLEEPIEQLIENESGEFYFKIIQKSENAIQLISHWNLKENIISKEEIVQLEEFYSAIEDLNWKEVKFRIQNDK